jgi:hypothetical protein
MVELLLALAVSDYMTLICLEAPDLTKQQIKERAEEMFPYRMGMNNHKDIYYYGLSCKLNAEKKI